MSRLFFVAPLFAACLSLHPDQAGAASRYACQMLDGSNRVVALDLSAHFPSTTVGRCARLPDDPVGEAPASDVRQMAAIGRPEAEGGPWMARTPAYRIIEAPPSRLYAYLPPLAGQGSLMRRAALRPLIHSAAIRQGLDPVLVDCLVNAESRHQARARSPKGAVGLMQIMPTTAQRYGVFDVRSLMTPEVNLDVGTRHLRSLLQRFNGRVDLALAAYNAGEGAVVRHGNRVPPYSETRNYVRDITREYALASKLSGRYGFAR